MREEAPPQVNVEDFDYMDNGMTYEDEQFESDLDSLNVSSSVINKIKDAGYTCFDDLKGQDALSLSKECGISHKDALTVVKAVKGPSRSSTFNHTQPQASLAIQHSAISLPSATLSSYHGGSSTFTALDTFNQQQHSTKFITTFCEDADQLLGGGIPLGRTTDISGVPGVGKTQLAIQLALNVQLPEAFGGCDGECLFIDTEGSFMIERVEQMACSLSQHLQTITERSATSNEEELCSLKNISTESLLNGIKYFRVYNLMEQLAFVQILDEYLGNDNRIKLIIFDTITFHFRHDQMGFGEHKHRMNLLQRLSQKLSQIASNRNIAVVYLTQATTRVTNATQGHLVPFGDSWMSTSNQLFLEFERGARRMRVSRGFGHNPSSDTTSAHFIVTGEGVRSANNSSKQQQTLVEDKTTQQNSQSPSTNNNSKKRPREED